MSAKNKKVAVVGFVLLSLAIAVANAKTPANGRGFQLLSTTTTYTIPPVPVLVTNGTSQPVPVQSTVAPTTVVFSGPLLFTAQNLDVSAYNKIRVSFLAPGQGHGGGQVVIKNLDGADAVTIAAFRQLADTASIPFTGLLELPGKAISVEGAALDGTSLNVVIDGR
jgi:hypothetical protein